MTVRLSRYPYKFDPGDISKVIPLVYAIKKIYIPSLGRKERITPPSFPSTLNFQSHFSGGGGGYNG